MIKAIVKLVSIDDVKDFVKKANMYSYDIDLSLGKYTVDGKSIMGIFRLDLGREIEMTVHSDKTDFLDDVAEHIVRK